MLDPTHPDLAPVLGLLDPCEACAGDGYFELMPGGALTVAARRWSCRACNGSGKALHPDRVAGALKRWLWSVGEPYYEGVNVYSNYPQHPSVVRAVNCTITQNLRTPEDHALAYCRISAKALAGDTSGGCNEIDD